MVVLNSSFLQARSVHFHSSTASTRRSKVFPIVPAIHRCLHRPVTTTMCLHVACMCLRVVLTHRRVRLKLLSEALLPTSFHPVLCYSHYSMDFYCFFIFLVLLFLCISVFILLFVLFFVGFNLPAMMWFNLEEEIDVGGCPLAPLWFSVVLALQLSFCSDSCFTCIRLFTEFLWIYIALCGPRIGPACLWFFLNH